MKTATISLLLGEPVDERLKERLELWHKHIEVLQNAEKEFLALEAEEDSLYSELFLASPAKTIAEKEAQALSSEPWRQFQKKLVQGKIRFNHERRVLELKQKAYESEYLTYKLEGEAIQRWPKNVT